MAEESDCGILLEINNIFVSAFNHGFDARTYCGSRRSSSPRDKCGPGPPNPAGSMQLRLAEVQRLLYRFITSPNGVEKGLAVENDVPKNGIGALITEDDRMNAVDRVGIYADMYFYRLLDAIRVDFSATVEILGNAHFHNLITSCLVACPPSRPSITDASRNLAEFVQHSAWCDEFPFSRDVILVDRALLEVFLAADAVAISFDELRAVPPSAWASLRFRAHPASRVLECEWRRKGDLFAHLSDRAVWRRTTPSVIGCLAISNGSLSDSSEAGLSSKTCVNRYPADLEIERCRRR